MVANDLLAADFMFKQSCNYTYFCHKLGTYTYIDHVLVSSYDTQPIKECLIIPEEAGNVSDHLPIKLSLSIPVNRTPPLKSGTNVAPRGFPVPSWSNLAKNGLYRDNLAKKIESLQCYVPHSEKDRTMIKIYIDQYISNLNSAIHEAALEAGCIPSKCFKPKPYWCPELSRLRNKKRFWWKLWIDNGRPQTGVISECYRGIKTLYRKVS